VHHRSRLFYTLVVAVLVTAEINRVSNCKGHRPLGWWVGVGVLRNTECITVERTRERRIPQKKSALFVKKRALSTIDYGKKEHFRFKKKGRFGSLPKIWFYLGK
jgi:hypothetical protein